VRPYLKKPFTKIGLVEWLKVKALSSIPSTAKERERERTRKSKKTKPQISRRKKKIGPEINEMETV
jgi:hypothetical protein